MIILSFILGLIIVALATTLILGVNLHRKRERKSLMMIHSLLTVIKGLEEKIEELEGKEEKRCGCTATDAGSPQGDETVCEDKPLGEKPATKKARTKKKS